MKNILLIGDNCTDVYEYGTVDRISPEAPVPVFSSSHSETKPGMGANVSLNLVKFGVNVVNFLSQKSIKTRFIDTRSKQHIMRSDIDVKDAPLEFEYIKQNYYLNNADAIVVSDYDKGYVSYKLIRELRENYNGPIFVDTKKKDLAQIEGCFIKINRHEESILTSRPTSENLIVTLGGDGVTWAGNNYPTQRVEVVDVCGAGDTFLAALVCQYLKTNDIGESIKYANRAGAISVQHSGVYVLTTDDIKSIEIDNL